MDYGHPAPPAASANIGDHVQSIASLGHLVRHQGVRFHGREDLVDLLERLRGADPPELRRERRRRRPRRDHRPPRRVDVPGDPRGHLVARLRLVHAPDVPEALGFPLHRNLRPLFVSFHCNKRDLLTPEAIDYLKRYGPIGCRDWTTVDLLLSVGVPAFFSGCLTTTVDTVFPDCRPPARDAPVAYVDVAAEVPEGARRPTSTAAPAVRRSFRRERRPAIELLETYRREHRRVVTCRLHCYLPVRSLGVAVDFQPKNRSDIRFDGLIDIADDEFDAIRAGIDDKLERVFARDPRRPAEEEVYARWRELTAADVAAAEERHRTRPAPPVADGDRRAGGRGDRARPSRHGRPPPAAVDCAVVLPQGRRAEPSVLVASLLEHASRPLHLWVLARGRARAHRAGAGGALPGARVHMGADPRARARARHADRRRAGPASRGCCSPTCCRAWTASCCSRCPAVATGDVAELAELDLGATRSRRRPGPGTRGQRLRRDPRRGARLEDRTEAAPRSAAPRTRGTRSTSTRSRATCSCSTSPACGRAASPARRCRSSRSSGSTTPRRCTTSSARTGRAAGALGGVPTRTPARGPGLLHWADGSSRAQPGSRRSATAGAPTRPLNAGPAAGEA